MLVRVVAALRASGVRAAVASGATPVAELGDVPSGWLVREYLPQVRLLGEASAAVTHGGNNSVTESVATATPMLVLPFSTDQFAGAAAVERAGVGEALDPNMAPVDEIRAALVRIMDLSGPGTQTLRSAALALDQDPGPARAWRASGASAIS